MKSLTQKKISNQFLGSFQSKSSKKRSIVFYEETKSFGHSVIFPQKLKNSELLTQQVLMLASDENESK